MSYRALVALLAAAPAFAQTAAGALASQREARALVDAALRAHGGDEAIAAAGPIVVTFSGRRTMVGQSQSPLPPYGTESWPIKTWFDLARNRIVQEQDNHFPGGYLLRYRFVATAETAFSLNLNGSFEGEVVDRSPAADLEGTRAWLARELPITLLLHARERAASLRRAGGDALLAEADGRIVTLRFDPSSHLLVGYETIGDHGFVGDDHFVVEWSGWKTQAGLVVPTIFREVRNGRSSREGTLAVAFAPPDEAAFAIPHGFVEAPPDPPPVRPLADGVGLVYLPDATQVMYVDLGDGILVIEAPSSSAMSEQAIARIEAAVPGKPIRWVTFTHAHNDHAAGLRPYIARGVRIVTTEANRGYVEAQATAPHTLRPDRLSAAPRAPVLAPFQGETALGGGRVRLYSIGKTAHALDTIVAYLPAERILYQGDMLIRPRAGGRVTPGGELTRALERLVRDKDLAVDQVVGTHGPPGTMADVREAIAKAPKP